MRGRFAIAALLVLGAAAPAAADAPDAAPAAPAPPSEAPPPPKGPPPEVTLECAPEPVRVGEPLVCTLTAIHRADVSVTVPAPAGATAMEADEANPRAAQKLPDGRLKTVRRFRLVQMEVRDDLDVPAFTVRWQEASGGEGTLEVPGREVPLKLLTANVPEPAFRTFREPGEGQADALWAAHGPVPYLKTNWPLIIALIVLAGAGLGFGVAWAIRRWLESRPEEEAPYVDPRPAHVIALEALAALQAERLPEQGRMKEFYFRLSEIVRQYLERRYGFPAPEMTSDEIRSAIGRLGLAEHARYAIEDFLVETDLVKFADFNPDAAQVEAVTRAARGLIALTRAPDEPEAEAAEAEAPA